MTCMASSPGRPRPQLLSFFKYSHAADGVAILFFGTRSTVIKPPLPSPVATCVYQSMYFPSATIDGPGQKRPSVRFVILTRHFFGDFCALLTVASFVPAISNPKASPGPAPGLLRTASKDTKSFLPFSHASSGQYQRSSVPVSKKERGFSVYCFCQKYSMMQAPPAGQVE